MHILESRMTKSIKPEDIKKLRDQFCSDAKIELNVRWKSWKLDYSQIEFHEVIAALLARQVTLATSLANSPTLWNWDMAPLVLRPMTEVYLNLAWIFAKPLERSQAFIKYGLGQMKLRAAHLKENTDELSTEQKAELESKARSLEEWVDSQRYTFLLDVNLGKWAENQRKMADDVDELDFYIHCYTPYSAGVHSMWHHVGIYNLRTCTNPLHRFHKVPCVRKAQADAHFLFLSGKYLNMALKLFDEKTGIKCECPSAFEKLCTGLRDNTH